MPEDDDWIENRIRFKAGKHKLPAGKTSFFDDASDSVRQSVAPHFTTKHGSPVLLAYDSPNRWSVIATRQFVGFDNGQLSNCSLAEVDSMTSRDYPPADFRELGISHADMGRLKGQWEFLRVTLHDKTNFDFWVPAGGEAFAFWNILLTVTRIAAQSRPT